MRIGVPRELKPLEGRVGLTPAACVELVRGGHQVFVEAGAGEKSGYTDQHYRDVGVTVLPSAREVYACAELIVKVKEPIEPDLEHLRREHLLFCYLHLAALPELARRLCDIGLTAIAFETVEDRAGRLPLLAPMSEIAGRIATQAGAFMLEKPLGGRGILLGGLGAFQSLRGMRGRGGVPLEWHWRPLFILLASVALFILLTSSLGLIVATLVLVFVASAASAEFRWREALIAGAVQGMAAAALFVYALGLPLPVWPPFFGG